MIGTSRGSRVKQRELGSQLVAQFPSTREEEVELEQFTQAHRLVPGGNGRAVGPPGDRQQRELGDRPEDERMDRAVAVEGRHQVLARTDSPDCLGALGVGRQHARGDELLKGAPNRRSIRQVGSRRRPASLAAGSSLRAV